MLFQSIFHDPSRWPFFGHFGAPWLHLMELQYYEIIFYSHEAAYLYMCERFVPNAEKV